MAKENKFLSPEDERRAYIFQKFYELNVNEKTEKKDNLTYLSWAWAWAEFKKVYPSATYEVVRNPETHLPYVCDPNVGIMVFTKVTVEGITYEMWLPVMDYANKAMRFEPYTYQVWDRTKKCLVEKTVQAATMFDVNKTIMRCLTKNLAMFGLGLYIYAGEDLPEIPSDEEQTAEKKQIKKTAQAVKNPAAQAAPQPISPQHAATLSYGSTLEILNGDPYAGIKQILANLKSIDDMMALYQEHKNEVESNPDIKMLFGIRKGQINKKIA